MPVASETANVVISNCVINLSPDKPAAFREAFRAAMRDAGFVDIEFTRRPAGAILLGDLSDPLVAKTIAAVGVERARAIAETVWSYEISARKP